MVKFVGNCHFQYIEEEVTVEAVIGPLFDNDANSSDEETICIGIKTPIDLDTTSVSCQIYCFSEKYFEPAPNYFF